MLLLFLDDEKKKGYTIREGSIFMLREGYGLPGVERKKNKRQKENGSCYIFGRMRAKDLIGVFKFLI
jgi:hypothetical protein